MFIYTKYLKEIVYSLSRRNLRKDLRYKQYVKPFTIPYRDFIFELVLFMWNFYWKQYLFSYLITDGYRTLSAHISLCGLYSYNVSGCPTIKLMNNLFLYPQALNIF